MPTAIAPYLRAAPWLVAIRLIGVVVSGLGPVALAWLTKQIIDRLVAGGPVMPLVAGLAAVGAGMALVNHVSTYADREISRRVSTLITDRLFEAVSRPTGIEQLEDPQFLDRLQLAQQSAMSGSTLLTSTVLYTAQGLITIVGFLTTLLAVSPPTAALVFVSAVPMLFAQLRLARLRADTQLDISPSHRRQFVYARLLTDVRAGKEIRLFGIGPALRRRMMAELGAAQRQERGVDRAELRVNSVGTLLTEAVSIIAMVLMICNIAAGHGTVGDLSILVGAVSGVQTSIHGLIHNLAQTQPQLIQFRYYHDIVTASAPDARAVDDGVPAGPLRQRIQLHDVWFRYGADGDWVLRGLDLTLDAGTAVALVGLNGAGKSTLVKLLCRMYEPTRGRITWDGVDLETLDPATLRTRIGVLFQDFMQYDLTAHENIAVGRARMLTDPHPDDADLVGEAARLSGAHESLAALPDGYATLLSLIFFQSAVPRPDGARRRSRWRRSRAETPAASTGQASSGSGRGRNGVNLSGGQWQRLALARAVLRRDADLLILDEPSSGLDAEAEHDIHARLVQLRSGRTSLLISHRLSTVRDADAIVVLREGQIVERGTHDELMATDGPYSRLFRTQAQGYQLDGSAAGDE